MSCRLRDIDRTPRRAANRHPLHTRPARRAAGISGGERVGVTRESGVGTLDTTRQTRGYRKLHTSRTIKHRSSASVSVYPGCFNCHAGHLFLPYPAELRLTNAAPAHIQPIPCIHSYLSAPRPVTPSLCLSVTHPSPPPSSLSLSPSLSVARSLALSLAHENDVLITVAPNHHFANSSNEIWPLPSSSSILKMACISSEENSLPSSLATTPSSEGSR